MSTFGADLIQSLTEAFAHVKGEGRAIVHAPVSAPVRKLRRYQRRWKIERLFAWLQNCRKLVTRYERPTANFLAFLKLAAFLILAKKYL